MKCVQAPLVLSHSALSDPKKERSLWADRPVKRVSNELAEKLISEGWSYCPKKLWKDSGRRR